MKNIKSKLLLFAATLILSMSLCACGKTDSLDDTGSTSQTTTATTQSNNNTNSSADKISDDIKDTSKKIGNGA